MARYSSGRGRIQALEGAAPVYTSLSWLRGLSSAGLLNPAPNLWVMEWWTRTLLQAILRAVGLSKSFHKTNSWRSDGPVSE